MSYMKRGRFSSALLFGTCVAAMAIAAPVAAQDAQEPADAGQEDGEQAASPANADAAIIVTGTRLSTSGFNAPTPVAVIGEDMLNARAKGTIAETLSEMPSFRQTTGAGQGQRGTINAGQALLDLRGLGRARTLVLVNGQRVVGTSGDGSFDTNMIPSIMVQRTDVVTGGASAAYGSDAVAGVVNFVTNRTMEGISGRAQYGVTKYGDNEEYLAGLAAGIKLGDRGHLVIGGEYAKSLGAPDQFNRPWAREQSGLVVLTGNRPAGTPANIFTRDAQSAIPAGGLITSCVQGSVVQAGGACPLFGTTFNSNGQPGAFEFGSLVGSTTMIGGGNEFHHPEHYVNLRQAYNRWAVMGALTYELTDSITAHLDLMGGRFNNKSQSVFYIAQANSIRVNRDNPFLPTAIAAQMDAAGISQIRMSRQNEDRGGIKPNNVNSYYQAAFGLEGSVFENWSWDAAASYGRSSFTYSASDFQILPNYWSALHAVRDGSGNIVCGSLATNPMAANISAIQRTVIEPGCVPFNPFGANRSDQLPGAYDYIYGTSSRTEVFKRFNAQINLAGSPFSTWAGPVSVATGYEYRQDRVSQTIPAEIAALSAGSGFFATNFLPGSGKVTVNEGYGEIGVPLLDRNSGLGQLDFNGAVRYTNYSSSGSVATWKVGAVFEPIPAIRLRGTYSRDIRAPNIPELAIPGLEGLSTFTRPDTLVTGGVRTQQVSNPNLKPEKAKTLTVGVVLQPGGAFDGLRVSVDYFDIRISDVIAGLSANEVIQRRFGRGDTSLDPFITYDNSAIGISKVGSPLLNLNSQTTRGFDMELNYRFPEFGIGKLMLVANATYTTKLETINDSGSSLGNLAGESRGAPKLRANITLNHEAGRFNTILNGRYTSSIRYRYDFQDASDAGYNPASATSINDNHFPSSFYLNLTENIRLTDRNDGPTAFFVIDNLLDKNPPLGSFIGFATVGGFNPYDVLGRSYKIGFRFKY